MDVHICEDTKGETLVVIHCRRIDDDTRRLQDYIQNFRGRLTGRASNGSVEILPTAEILYFESVDGRTFAYTESSVLEVTERLYELEDLLAEQGFVRVSKSVVANLRCMRSLKPDLNRTLLATMTNGECLHVSRRYAAVLRDRLHIGRRK